MAIPAQPLRAASFDGVDDYASVASLDLSDTDKVTVCFDMSFDSAPGSFVPIVEFSSNYNSFTGTFVIAFNTGDVVTLGIHESSYNTASYVLPGDGANHRYTAILDRSQPNTGELRLYIDGALQSGTVGFNANSTGNYRSDALYIASRNGASFFGDFDLHNLRIYKAAFTTQQASDYNATPYAEEFLDPFLNLAFEEAGTTAYDSAAGANHATKFGGVASVNTALDSLANTLGHSDGAGGPVPIRLSTRNDTPILDALGNTMQYGQPESNNCKNQGTLQMSTRDYTLPASAFDAAATDFPLIIRTSLDGDLARAAKADGSNLRFSLSDGTTPPQTIGYAGVLETDVAWTVPSEPYAVRHTSPGVDRTFVGLYRHQAAVFDIGQYDHLTGKWTTNRLAATSPTETNDHNGVTIAVHPDGTVFAFCPQHNTASLRAFRSDSPADISSMTELSFGAVDVANAAYAQPLFVGTKLFVTWRDGEVTSERPRVFTTSTDKGATWSTRKELIRVTSERPYPHIKEKDGMIHVCFSKGLDTELPDGQNHLYHGYLDLEAETFHKSDGTLIGTVDAGPLSDLNATLLMSAATGGKNLRTANVGFDSAGRVVCGVLEIRSIQENVYHQARWDGTSWSNEEVVTGGESLYGPWGTSSPGYLPGLFQCLDGDKMLASVQVADRTHEVREYTRQGEGTWTYKVLSSANSGEKLRPVEVANGHPDMQYLFLSGEYNKFTDVNTRLDLCGYPGPIATGRLTALLQVSVDGVNDLELKLHVGSAGPSVPIPFSTAVVKSVGEIGRRTILDDSSTNLDGLAAITLVGAAVPTSFSVHQYYASDYGLLTTERHLLFRLNTSGQPNLALRMTDEATYQVTGTDIAATIGGIHAIGASYDGATISIARNGSLSAVSTAATLPLRNSDSVPLYAGASPNATEADQIVGSEDFLMILPTSKSDDWIRMATLGCGPAAYTALPMVLSESLESVAKATAEEVRNSLIGGLSVVSSGVSGAAD